MIIPKLIEYLTEGLSEETPEQPSRTLGDDQPEEQTEDPSIYVGVEAPEQKTNYVLIDQTGSSMANHIMTTTVAVQCYGKSLYDAMELNETVKGLMIDFAAEAEVASVRFETDYNFTNTATKQYRWQAVYQITHYLGGI